MVSYLAAKADLQNLTRTLALDLGKYGIIANAVAPGFIETDMTRGPPSRRAQQSGEMRALVAAALPERRTGVPSDVAMQLLYLRARKAGYIVGQTFLADRGQTLPRSLVELIEHYCISFDQKRTPPN
jgi:3-oxoacyl-[acyl-carrier protein] reductase